MRLALAAAAASVVLAACGPSASPHTTQAPPAALTCDNVVVPPIAAIDGMVQDLGTLAVGATPTFTVPAGTAAFFIVSQAVGTTGDGTITASGSTIPNAVVPTSVRSPTGVVYYDDWAAVPTTTISGLTYDWDYTNQLADPGLDAAVGVFSFPNTSGGLRALASAGSVEAGTWSFTVNDYAYECAQSSPASCTGGSTAGRYRVHVVTRPTPTTTPTLDVEVYLATAPGSVLPSAAVANAPGNAQVARWKQSLAYYLGQGGIALGPVIFDDLSAAAKAQYAPNGAVDVGSTDPCSNLSQLFTHGLVQSRAVSVFLADDLIAPAVGPGLKIAGIDGSIPGPSGFPGTINSGAIVGLADFGYEKVPGACSAVGPPSVANCGTDLTAYVAAHEIGHWLGLYHVTEQHGTLFDPIADTSVCPCHACAALADQPSCADANPSASAPTLITAGQCVVSAGCGGGDNLMFWEVSDSDTVSTGALSPDQAQVMRLNPAVH